MKCKEVNEVRQGNIIVGVTMINLAKILSLDFEENCVLSYHSFYETKSVLHAFIKPQQAEAEC